MMASTRVLSKVQEVDSLRSRISGVNGSADERPHNVPEHTVVDVVVTAGVADVVMVAVAVAGVGVVTVVAEVIGVGGTIVDPP